MPSSTIALQRLVIGYSYQVTEITKVWDFIAEELVSNFEYDKESITIGDPFTEDEVRELERKWKIKLPLGFIALLRTPRVLS